MSLSIAMLFLSSITARGVIDPMAVAAPAGGDSALYFVLRNSAWREDRLLGVSCDCAARIEIDGDGATQAWPVAMPPARLQELRPGASRHLVLRRLTRPLVAGETITISLQYSDGAERRDVRVVAEPEAGWAAGVSERRSRMAAPLNELAGWCWRGTSRGGRHTDTRCFSPAYDMFMQDRHVVEDGAATTTDRSLYMRDVMAMAIGFQTTRDDGPPAPGSVVPIEGGVSFVTYTQDRTGHITEDVVTHWRRDGADAWQVVAESRRPGARRELWRLRMVRAGRAPAL